MLDLLQFAMSGFWTFIGTVIILYMLTFGLAVVLRAVLGLVALILNRSTNIN